MTQYTFATRKSALALAQSRAFAMALVKAHGNAVAVDELHITTSGDRFQEQRLQDIGGKGLFIKELEEALLDGRAHFAVHSIKDVPAELPEGLHLACIPKREDPRDVLVAKNGGSLEELPPKATIGTSSLRRAVCLLKSRTDLTIQPARGNVDTRLRKVEEGVFDGIVLALAGLKRLGLEGRATMVLDSEVFMPAIGQGALGIECRRGDAAVESLLAPLEHRETRICVEAERAVMAAVGGSCRMPIAAYAKRVEGRLVIRAFAADPDGSRVRESRREIPWPDDVQDSRRVGSDLGAELA